MAKMHERLHDLDQARHVAQQAHELVPRFEQARILLAILELPGGDPETAQAELEGIINRKAGSAGLIGEAWYELAAIHDKGARYDQAYDAIAGSTVMGVPPVETGLPGHSDRSRFSDQPGVELDRSWG